MRQIRDITLTANQSRALEELRRRLCRAFDVKTLILYGSLARGEADQESDQDLLVVTERPLSRPERDRITEVVFEVNLHYETNLSTLVVDRESWENGPFTVLPIRSEILRDGVLL